MTDMSTMVVDYLHEDLNDPNKKKTQYSWLIRTYDAGTVRSMIACITQEHSAGVDAIRYVRDTPMLCTECERWSEQQEYALDENEKQAKCPLCHLWVYIEECDTEEV